MYFSDFEHMLQYRRNDPSRRRRIKRDVASAPKKGVAGLRMESESGTSAAPVDDGEDSNENDVATALDTLNINDDEE